MSMTFQEEQAAFEQGVKLGVEIALTVLSPAVYEHGIVAMKHPELFMGKVRKIAADALASREVSLNAVERM